MALESIFKRKLIKQIEHDYPGAIVLKIHANYMQGIPDNIILFEKKWAIFEAKADEDSSHRLNQDYYINILNNMSLASFVYPQNKEKFLYELQRTLRPSRSTRILIR